MSRGTSVITIMGRCSRGARRFTASFSSALTLLSLLILTVTAPSSARTPRAPNPSEGPASTAEGAPRDLMTDAGERSPRANLTNGQLARMPLWPPVAIRALLNGSDATASDGDTAANSTSLGQGGSENNDSNPYRSRLTFISEPDCVVVRLLCYTCLTSVE